MYIHLNLNPYGQDTGDCVIRALTLALNYNWFMVHDELSFLSRKMADMPSSNRVWKTYLSEKGYREEPAQNTCPNCLTVEAFCRQHPVGRYILSTCEYTKARDNLIVTGTHVVTVIDGDWYDSWDSGADVPLSFFYIYAKGCCFDLTVKYVSGVTDGTTTPTPSINVINANLDINRIA